MKYGFQDIISPNIPGNSSETGPVLSALAMTVSISFFRLLSLLGYARLAILAPSGHTKAEVAFNTLQTWYNTSSGIYDTTGWWNSANCLTAVGDLAAIDATVLPDALGTFLTTAVKAPKYNLQMQKVVTDDFNIISYYGPSFPPGFPIPPILNPKGFLNGYYDDEGWWALAWIQAFDVTKNPLFLQTSINIFNDMEKGSTTPCGGIWWDKNQTYVNAIANELYLSVGAHLANRVLLNKNFYLENAKSQWAWFQKSGMINSKNLINDGLKDCRNNNGTVWSYNQGVILGGLTELFYATGDQSYLTTATSIANAAITALQDKNKVLHDPCEPDCGADGSQFKGVFMRNLQILQKAAPSQTYVDFAAANAASIWAYDRDASDGVLSEVWSGPFVTPGNASTQSSALDALIADQAFGDSSAGVIASREGGL
ncbi:Mannan endo-1,6-alpha-mannosidase DFG5 [Lachnellula cervina]|uniref:Mannan endo-1,6-alpha-mannosidase DFG5 n=1 Tax=Lachnellula cervina TaxID=1316786 RepID=A0A7D8YX08_9HELO|nr:Mannan endo-1,6-alpha-mannosidase DFG5 [Lachnellula cervina]